MLSEVLVGLLGVLGLGLFRFLRVLFGVLRGLFRFLRVLSEILLGLLGALGAS